MPIESAEQVAKRLHDIAERLDRAKSSHDVLLCCFLGSEILRDAMNASRVGKLTLSSAQNEHTIRKA